MESVPAPSSSIAIIAGAWSRSSAASLLRAKKITGGETLSHLRLPVSDELEEFCVGGMKKGKVRGTVPPASVQAQLDSERSVHREAIKEAIAEEVFCKDSSRSDLYSFFRHLKDYCTANELECSIH